MIVTTILSKIHPKVIYSQSKALNNSLEYYSIYIHKKDLQNHLHDNSYRKQSGITVNLLDKNLMKKITYKLRKYLAPPVLLQEKPDVLSQTLVGVCHHLQAIETSESKEIAPFGVQVRSGEPQGHEGVHESHEILATVLECHVYDR